MPDLIPIPRSLLKSLLVFAEYVQDNADGVDYCSACTVSADRPHEQGCEWVRLRELLEAQNDG